MSDGSYRILPINSGSSSIKSSLHYMGRVVRNDLDRFHLLGDVIDRVSKLGYIAAYTKTVRLG